MSWITFIFILSLGTDRLKSNKGKLSGLTVNETGISIYKRKFPIVSKGQLKQGTQGTNLTGSTQK